MKLLSVTPLQIVLLGVSAFSFLGYCALTGPGVGDTRFDDAFMFVRYAQHWLDGDGFAWNPGEGAAFGITSPLYLALITSILGVTSWSAASVLAGTSFVTGIAAVVALVFLGFQVQWYWRGSRHSWLPLLLVPLLFSMPAFSYHSLSGMETTLSLLLNTLLLIALIKLIHAGSSAALFVTVCVGLACVATRPDSGLYVALLPPLLILALNRQAWRRALHYVVLFGVGGLLLVLCYKWQFGDYLPLPVFAKAAGFYDGYLGVKKWNTVHYLLTFWGAVVPLLLVVGWCCQRSSALPVLVLGFVLTLTFAYLATVTQIMGMHARYYFPSIPFVCFAAFLCLYQGLPSESKAFKPPLSDLDWRGLIALVILFPVMHADWNNKLEKAWQRYAMAGVEAQRPQSRMIISAEQALPHLDWWQGIQQMTALLQQMPAGTSLAASEYGLIGAALPQMPIVDLVGLHDRRVARHGFDIHYMLNKEPDLIWLPHADYTAMRRAILDSRQFQQAYDYFPDAYNYGIAVRKESPRYTRITQVLRAEFARVYPQHSLQQYLANFVDAGG